MTAPKPSTLDMERAAALAREPSCTCEAPSGTVRCTNCWLPAREVREALECMQAVPAREPTTLDAMRAATEAVAAACSKAFEDGERSASASTAARARREEREACAQLCDAYAEDRRALAGETRHRASYTYQRVAASYCAELIRARTQPTAAPTASDPPVAPAEATGTTDGGTLPPDVDTSGLADSAARTSAPFGVSEQPKPVCEHGTPYPKACHPCFVEWGRELQRVVLPNDKPARPIGGPRTGAPFEAMAEADASPWLAPLRAALAAAEAKRPDERGDVRSLVVRGCWVARAVDQGTPERVREELLDVAVVALRWWMQVSDE